MINNFFLKHKNKLNQPAKILVLLLPLLAIAYFGFKIYEANKYQASYVLDFDKGNFNNKSLAFYISEDENSPKIINREKIDNTTIATVAGSPLPFVFQPKEFPLNKTLTFSAKLRDFGDWEISLVCPNCEKNDQYSWQPFYYGWLNYNYQKAITYPEASIYSSDTNRSWEKADNIKDWLAKNIKKDDKVSILDKAIPQSFLTNQNIDFKEGSSTILDKSIRGPHQFYVYLKDNLNLDIIKKDMNNYDNSDDVRVALYDLEDNLIKDGFISDDGITIKSKEFAPVLRKNINFSVPYSGIYKLSLEETGTNTTKDWLITYLKINTNKIMFVSGKQILFMQPINLYTDIKSATDLETSIWMKSQIQTTKISSTKYNLQINNTDNDLTKWKKITLEPENYQISYNGDQYLQGPNMSWQKDALFDVSNNQVNETVKPNIVITKYEFTKASDNFIEVKKQFLPQELNKLSDLKNINFQLRNTKLNERFITESSLYEKGFNILGQFNQYNLFGTKELSNNRNGADVGSWLNNVLPTNASIRLPDNLIITQNNLNKNSSDKRKIIIDSAATVDFELTESINPGPVLFKEVKINVSNY